MQRLRTVGDLRTEIEDTPDEMTLCVQIPGVSRFIHVKRVVWMDGKCVIVTDHPNNLHHV